MTPVNFGCLSTKVAPVIDQHIMKHLGIWKGEYKFRDFETGELVKEYSSKIHVGLQGKNLLQRNVLTFQKGESLVNTFSANLGTEYRLIYEDVEKDDSVVSGYGVLLPDNILVFSSCIFSNISMCVTKRITETIRLDSKDSKVRYNTLQVNDEDLGRNYCAQTKETRVSSVNQYDYIINCTE